MLYSVRNIDNPATPVNKGKLSGPEAQKAAMQEAMDLFKSAFQSKARILSNTSFDMDLRFEIKGGSENTRRVDRKTSNSRVVTHNYTTDYSSIKEAGLTLSKEVKPKINKILSSLKKKYEFSQIGAYREIYEKNNPPTLEYNIILSVK